MAAGPFSYLQPGGGGGPSSLAFGKNVMGMGNSGGGFMDMISGIGDYFNGGSGSGLLNLASAGMNIYGGLNAISNQNEMMKMIEQQNDLAMEQGNRALENQASLASAMVTDPNQRAALSYLS